MKAKRDTDIAKSVGIDISDFADVEHEMRDPQTGAYRAYSKGTRDEIGSLTYSCWADQHLLRVAANTHPDWRHRKIASALIEQLHRDYPDYFVDVGQGNPDDLEEPGFYYYLRDTLPDYRDTVIQEGARDD